MVNMKKKNNIVENIVVLMIFLVLVQTFLDDFAVIISLSWDFRQILLYTGLFFDLFFTVEFLIRFFSAMIESVQQKNGALKRYFLKERGWIDLLASLPLLVLNSGPQFYAMMTGAVFGGGVGILNVLKVVKSVRVARILRMLRLLKVFKQIKFADSTMVQRHSTKIITTVIAAIVLPVTIMSFVYSFTGIEDLEDDYTQRHRSAAAYIMGSNELLEEYNQLELYVSSQTEFLKIEKTGEILYSRYDSETFLKGWGPSDYSYFEIDEFAFWYNLSAVSTKQAWDNLLIFTIVIFVIIFLMVIYTPHFAITVSDPVNIMKKGMIEDNYNLEVSIPEDMEDDDIFQLSKEYNDKYLTMKMRQEKHEEKEEQSVLKIDDIEDLFGP